jgi:hypothetical protein
MNKIYQIFKQYKRKLSLIYLFMIFTELSILTQPFLLGKSIDNLIIGNIMWIILLSISFLFSSIFNYKRMVYDTKVYTQIYNDIVFKFLKNKNLDNSTKVARTDMARDIVGVLEGYVHYYIATIITIVGSIGFIYSENLKVGILISPALVVILLSVLVFYKKIAQSTKIKNNQYECKVKAIENTTYVEFFNRRRKLEIYESTLQGKNWFFVSIIKQIFCVLSIIVLVVTSTNVTVGSVIIVYSYVNNFLGSLTVVPVGFEMYVRLNDILKRVGDN